MDKPAAWLLSRHGKSSSYLYTDYIDLDTAAGTMYVFKEKQNEKKLYLSHANSAQETNSKK